MGHTGPGQNLGFVTPDLAYQVAAIALEKAEPVIRVGNLDVAREFADVRDVVRAYWTVMEKGEAGGVYNLSTNRPRTIREVAESLMAAAGVEAELVQDQERVRKVDESSPLLDTSKINALGFKFEIPFSKTMADVVEYWIEKIKSES
jgi:GDP-4-dehydro-6-deoxy-D-mannose reductase